MQLKYVGPKPMISEHGISFKDGKEDKYVYIQNAIEILHALNHEYVKGKIYKYDPDFSELSEKEVEDTIIKYKPELKKTIEKEINSYELHLKNEIENVKDSHPLLSDLELKALKNNFEIMHEYRVQKAINKIYYMHIIEIISDLIKEHKIKDISIPFNERFWHVLQTIQGYLAQGKNSLNSKLIQDENSILELQIRF